MTFNRLWTVRVETPASWAISEGLRLGSLRNALIMSQSVLRSFVVEGGKREERASRQFQE